MRPNEGQPKQQVRASSMYEGVHSEDAKLAHTQPWPSPPPPDKGKRPADEAEGSGRSSKRPAHDVVGPSGSGAAGDGTGSSGAAVPPPGESSFTRLGLQAKTIKDLQTILRAWNLAISGKKDDLIARVLEHQAGARS